MAVEKTLASVLESTPVQGDSPGRVRSVKFRLPEVSKRFLIPSKSKKNASLRAPAKNVKSPDVAMWGSSPTKETGTSEKIFSPTAFGRLGVLVGRQVDVDGLLAIARVRRRRS